MMQLLPTYNQTKKLFIDIDPNHTYTFSSNLFIRPNGYKHYLPVKYTNTILKWYENTLLHLEKNKFLQWTLITISDYETSIGLKLIQWDNELSTLVKHIAPILQQINLSNLKLNSIPLDVLCQFSTRLFSLNLSYNYIEMNIFQEMKSVYLWYKKQKSIDSRIKHEICWIQTINEIYLDHNKLEDQFPYEVLNYMTGLRRLYVQNNAITSLKGVNGLTQLNVLRADFNKITSLHEHFFSLKKIEYVYLSHNYITQPISGTQLKYLIHLKVIDLSHNGLSFLPAVIFSLPCLEILKVDHNNIYNLPTVRSNYRISKEPIQSIDLSYNQINAVSDGLLRITKHLDLSKNRLRIFPAGMLKMIVNMMQLKKTKPSEIIQLDLTDNPMIWPPYNIVESGINTMVQYFLESRTEIQTYYGIKTTLLGIKNCGKTSLALSIVDRQNRLTESLEETTYSVESYTIHYDANELTPKLSKVSQENNDSAKLKASTSRPSIITMWDCSGYMAYIPIISYFTSLSTVITILVDITKFTQTTPVEDSIQLRNPSNYFYQSVGVWLDVILYRLNYLKVILLATKCDLISSDKELNQRIKCLYSQTLNYLKIRKFWLKDQITRIESSLQISQATSKYYEHLNEIYENSYTFVYPSISPISLKQSSLKMIDFNQLCLTLFDVAIKTPTYIPFCLTPLPQIWSDIEMYLDDLKHDYNTNTIIHLSNYTMNGCILPKYDFCHLLQVKFNLTTINLKQLLTYLNNTGKILILDAYLTKEEEKYYNVTMKSFIRPYPNLYVLINPDLFLQSLKYLLHPNLYCIIDNKTNRNAYNDFYVTETFEKDLLRHFYTVTQQSAINRLMQSCNELKRGTGIVSAYLWIALVEYSNLFVTKHNINTGKSYVEILWRWLELAYPVPEPDLFVNFNYDSKMITSSNEMNSSIWKFKYFPSPREMAVACGIISSAEKPTESLDNHSDTDESENSDSQQSSTNEQIQSLLCPERLPALCFPCLIPDSFCSPTDEMSNNLWNTAGQTGPRPIIFVYRFSYGIPQELFDKATVRLNWPELFNFRYTSHWKTGVQMFNSSSQIVLRFLLIKSFKEDSLIKFEFRALHVTNTSSEITELKTTHHDTNSEKNMLANVPNHTDGIPLTDNSNKREKHKQKPKWHNWPISEENLWNLMLPILTEFDAVLLAYKGLCYKRVMECPKCNELTLAGEWLAPNEVQAVKYRKCPACAHRIPSCFIAPPASGLEYKHKTKSKRKPRKPNKSRK